MKNYMNFLAVLAIATVFSCQKEDLDPKGEQANVPEAQEQMPDEITDKLTELAYNPNDVVPWEQKSIDGSKEKGYLVEGDIFMTKGEIMDSDIFADQGGIQSEQYHTKNLIRVPKNGVRTIKIVGFSGKYLGLGLTPKLKTGLQRAVTRYNGLNLRIRFQLTFSTNYANADMVFFRKTDNRDVDLGNRYPANGNPPKMFYMHATHEKNKTQHWIDYHIIHAMGHAIGMRHVDWAASYSCGRYGVWFNRRQGSKDNLRKAPKERVYPDPGALWIPGTPKGKGKNSLFTNDWRSVFSRCTSIHETWDNVPVIFSKYDKIALRYMY